MWRVTCHKWVESNRGVNNVQTMAITKLFNRVWKSGSLEVSRLDLLLLPLFRVHPIRVPRTSFKTCTPPAFTDHHVRFQLRQDTQIIVIGLPTVCCP